LTRVCAIYMPKGGVGKSFLAGHLATGLAIAGRRVLAIDADPGQGHLTLRMAGVERRGDLLRLLRYGASDELLQQHPRYPNLWVVTTDPRDVDQFGPLLTGSGPYWPWLLKERLEPWLDGRFDYILFDTGPGFESPVTTCVIQASSELWVPYAVEYESLDSYMNLVGQLLPKARKDPESYVTHVIPNKLVLGKERIGADDEGELMSEGERRRAELIRRARTNDSVAILEMLKKTHGRRMTPPVRMAEAVSQKTAGGGAMIWETDPESEVAMDLSFVVEAIIEREGATAHGAA
jgi:cellulose biosynthesis protein BcsQ